jgi:hypothetical protein
MKTIEAIPFITVQVGWKRCVACSDFKQAPGVMWVGYQRSGADETIPCPVCKGTGQEPIVKHLDLRTGREIDYERPGQTFVHADGPGTVSASDVIPSPRIIFTD